MTMLRLHARTPKDIVARGGDAFALAIAADAACPWEFRIFAHLSGGAREMGRIYTQPSTQTGAEPARVIAAGACPGATHWSVEARCLADDFSDAGIDITVDLTTSAAVGAAYFSNLERRRTSFLSGAADSVTQLARYQRLVAWTARATGAIGAAIYNSGTPVVLPDGLPISAELNDTPDTWGARIEFQDVTSWVLQVEGA